jgi:hypothetical protein
MAKLWWGTRAGADQLAHPRGHPRADIGSLHAGHLHIYVGGEFPAGMPPSEKPQEVPSV